MSRLDTTDLLSSSEDKECRTNAKSVRCQKCNSSVLPVGKGTYEERPFDLFLMHAKKKSSPDGDVKQGEAAVPDKEKLEQFYRVEDKFDFDNVGFSKSVDDVQYLVCADCEVGPIGYFDKASEKCFVALARVKHV